MWDVITRLSDEREIFVSEADFQFALAWQIQKQYPEAEIRLEYCPADIDMSMHVDILVRLDGLNIPIELKYFKLGCDVTVNGERFVLKNQGAQDTARYDFIKDVSRIERLLIADPKFITGYVIALTNDPTYWNEPKDSNTCDAAFRIHEGTIKSGNLSWAEHITPRNLPYGVAGL